MAHGVLGYRGIRLRHAVAETSRRGIAAGRTHAGRGGRLGGATVPGSHSGDPVSPPERHYRPGIGHRVGAAARAHRGTADPATVGHRALATTVRHRGVQTDVRVLSRSPPVDGPGLRVREYIRGGGLLRSALWAQ